MKTKEYSEKPFVSLIIRKKDNILTLFIKSEKIGDFFEKNNCSDYNDKIWKPNIYEFDIDGRHKARFSGNLDTLYHTDPKSSNCIINFSFVCLKEIKNGIEIPIDIHTDEEIQNYLKIFKEAIKKFYKEYMEDKVYVLKIREEELNNN